MSGAKTHGRLIDEQHPGCGNQCSADCQHLLLPTAEGSCLLLGALVQDREQLVDPLRLSFDDIWRGPRRAGEKILAHTQAGEDPATLGRQSHTALDPQVRRLMGDPHTVEDDPAPPSG